MRSVKGYAKHYQLVIMFLPTMLALAIFTYAPMYGLSIAFKEYTFAKGIGGSPWVGFLQFQKLFMAPSFQEVLFNTVRISFFRLLCGFPAPVILALLLNEIGNARYKRIVQTISYLPHFLSWVVLGGIVHQILSPTSGLINQIMVKFGGEPIYFLASKRHFVPVLIVSGIWKEVGWSTIIYLAAISSVNPELFEAATIDGANRFQRVRHVVLPGIAPVISLMFILASGNLINAGFDQIFNLYSPAVYSVADIIDTYVYRRGLVEMKYSFSAAAGLFKNIVSFTLVLLTNVIVKWLNGKEAGIW